MSTYTEERSHDCNPLSVDSNTAIKMSPTDDLPEALGDVRLSGAVFLRAEYTEGWAYYSPPTLDLMELLQPGSSRLALFHLVTAGACWIELDEGERHHAIRGDVIVLPYGDQHTMGGTSEADIVPIANLLDPVPWLKFPVIRYGAGGSRTDVICGYLDAAGPLFDPSLRALPRVFVVHPNEATSDWVKASIEYAIEKSANIADGSVEVRIPELLLSEILRIHLLSKPAIKHGWLAALSDQVLAPALAAVHRSPEYKWTVAELAAESTVSRSVLDERFRKILGRPPIRYLTEWRMHLAQDLLSSSDLSVMAVAHRIGYASEEAFSRAFSRSYGIAPSHWRSRESSGR